MAAKKIALDAPLATLFAVGATSPEYIATYKRLSAFDADDLAMLDILIGFSDGVVWSAHVLTETSNWLNYARSGVREEAYLVLGSLIERWPEVMISSLEAARRPEFSRLGLTDAALLELAAKGAVIITTDGNLQTEALAAGLECKHFAEIREELRPLLA